MLTETLPTCCALTVVAAPPTQEAALLAGYEPYIVTWQEELLEGSGLPLKPACVPHKPSRSAVFGGAIFRQLLTCADAVRSDEIAPYSEGITVVRPDAVGNYKLLDGRYNLGMTSAIVEIARQDPTMQMTIMCLYLQPHAKIVLDAVEAIRGAWGESFDVTTIAEAVGSDVTNVLSNAMRESNFGAGEDGTLQLSFSALFLKEHGCCDSDHGADPVPHLRRARLREPVYPGRGAPSREGCRRGSGHRLCGTAALQVRAVVPGTVRPSSQMQTAAADSSNLTHALPLYSNVTEYTELSPDVASDVLSKRGLVAKKYVLYLSRVIEAKGIFELVAAYRASGLPAAGIQLLIVGRGEALKDVQDVTAGDPNIRHMTDMADAEKASIFNGAASCKLAMLSCHR